MSFETEAELSLTVDDGDLRNVKQQIEDGIGTTELGVTDGGSMSAQAGSGGGRRARRSMRLAEEQTGLLEDAVEYLEDIEDQAGTGGGGGGGGGVFTEILGVAGETAGDVAVEAGDTVADALTDVLTGTAATALGNTIASAVDESTVAVEPNPLPVSTVALEGDGGGGGGGTSVTVSPDVQPTFQPTFQPTVDVGPDINLPDLNIGGGGAGPVRVDSSQLPLPVEDRTLGVEEVGPLAVEDVGPITVAIEGPGRAPAPSGPDPRTGGELLKDAASSGAGGAVAGGAIGTISPDPFTTAGGAIVGGLTGIGSTLVGEAGRRLESGDNTRNSTSQTSTTVKADVSHSPTYNLEVDPRRFDQLAERIVSEIEDRVDRDIDEVRDDVEQIERDLDDLERDIRNGR